MAKPHSVQDDAAEQSPLHGNVPLVFQYRLRGIFLLCMGLFSQF
jgi:hypothetical protein